MRLDNYQYLGIGLLGFGSFFAGYSFIVFSNIPLTALGLSSIIIGASLLLVPSNPVPKEQVLAMIRGSQMNTQALLEEYDVLGKALYLDGDTYTYTFVSLEENPSYGRIEGIPEIRLRSSLNQVEGVFVFSATQEIVRQLDLSSEYTLEDALNMVLVDQLEVADSVKVVDELESILVEINGGKTGGDYDRINFCLGSLQSNLSGLIIARITGRPVYYIREEIDAGTIKAFFRYLEGFDG